MIKCLIKIQRNNKIFYSYQPMFELSMLGNPLEQLTLVCFLVFIYGWGIIKQINNFKLKSTAKQI